MRIVFAGSPEYSVPALEAVYKMGGLVAVVTQPDKPVGRKKILTPTPVKIRAQELNLPVYDFVKIRDNASLLKSLNADIMITCAYGQLLTQDILDCFKEGVWNLHASLLPEFRGASPIQSCILAGKTHTGVTVMKTELSVDTGDILLVKRIEVGDKTYGELQDDLSRLSAEAATEAIEYLKKGDNQLLMQDEAKATHCKKIEKQDAKINFSSSAKDICRLVRAMNPQPMAYCFQNGGVLNILKAQEVEYLGEEEDGEVIRADKNGILVKCAQNAINITLLVPSGGRKMSATDFVNGRKIKAGDKLD